MSDERLEQIMGLARRDGKVRVDELAEHFQITQQTIRKDLGDLCQKRLLVRIHGGAVIASGVENVAYEARRMMSAPAKQAIGKAAADLVPGKASLFLNIGTTTEEVAGALLQHEGLMVVTNNLNIANKMWPYPGINVVIAGGEVRHADGGVVGEATIDFIHQFKVDYAVIGTSAVDETGTLLDYDYREVKVAQAIMASSRHVILVADSTKFERSAPVRVGAFHQIDTLVTDTCRLNRVRALCQETETRLVEALPDG